MKFRPAALVVLALAGCSGNGLPATPVSPASPVDAPASPVAPTAGQLWVLVTDESGACIDGATIQIVGADVSEPKQQNTPCNAWDDSGGVVMKELAPWVELTLRGAATGYTHRDLTVRPGVSAGQAVVVTLSKAR
jgi:hypothetical protein